MPQSGVDTQSVAADQLKAFVERIERLEEEKAALAGDIREIYLEAKGNGFDTKAMRKIVALRKIDYAERQEQEAILELYMDALGMLGDTPLGRAARDREFGDTKVTISGPGMEPIETTAGGIKRAAAALELGNKVRRPRRAKPKQLDIEDAIRRTGKAPRKRKARGEDAFRREVGDAVERAFADRPDVTILRNAPLSAHASA